MVEFFEISGWYWVVFDLVAFIFILIKFRSYLFGKFLVAGLLISALTDIFYRTLEFYPGDPYLWFLSSTLIFAHVLIFIGITSITIPSSTQNGTPSPVKDLVTTQLLFKIRSLPITLLLMIITFHVYVFFWLYHNVRELRQLESNKLSFTPGQAIGLLFVPVFNLYWSVKVIISFTHTIKNIKENFQATLFGANYPAAFFSFLFILAFVTFGIGQLNLSFFFVGESLYLTAIIVTQHHINEIWRKVQKMQETH